MSETTASFYKTKLWQDCRRSYIKSVGGLCERCFAKGIIRHGDTVHHKIHLTSANINCPKITLNHDNLMLLCRDCHAEIHKKRKRYCVDESGKVIANE
ncbi:MAG: HNH endonuclease [Clostridiales bacterium]|nr:HNH endonuclease [Clostridiales bacterium]MBQ1571471.1 HNH endonuclease [Clostridiales bacterium]